MTPETDALRALRAFRAEDAVPDVDAHAAARAALMERIAAAAAPRTAAPHAAAPRARRPRRRLLAGGLGFAATAAAAAALVVGGAGSGGVQPETAGASSALRAAASVAAGGPDVALGAGRYWYVSSEHIASSRTFSAAGAQGGVVTYRLLDVRERTEHWIDSEGEGRMVKQMIGTPKFASPADRETWIAAGRPSFGPDHSWTLADGGAAEQPSAGWKELSGLSYDALRALSADDDALANRLAKVAAGSPAETFAFAANLLRTTPVSAAQRAALYRVLAQIPGVDLLGTVKDMRGRAGTGIALELDGVRQDLLFDPHTALLLDYSRRVTNPRQAGSDSAQPAQEEEAFLNAGVVDSTHARP